MIITTTTITTTTAMTTTSFSANKIYTLIYNPPSPKYKQNQIGFTNTQTQSHTHKPQSPTLANPTYSSFWCPSLTH